MDELVVAVLEAVLDAVFDPFSKFCTASKTNSTWPLEVTRTMIASSALQAAERAMHEYVPPNAPVFGVHVVVVLPLEDW